MMWKRPGLEVGKLAFDVARQLDGLPFDMETLITLVNEVLKAADALYNAYAASGDKLAEGR